MARALAARPILLNGHHRLNVEEKKLRNEGRGFSDRDRHDMGKRGSQVRVGNMYFNFNQFIFIFFRITYEALDILEVEEEVIEDVEEEGVVA